MSDKHHTDATVRKRYHAAEAIRIVGELNGLDSDYAENGIVRTVLRQRVEQERRRAEEGCDCVYCRRATSQTR